jgi:lysophospholipase L1-like esterase
MIMRRSVAWTRRAPAGAIAVVALVGMGSCVPPRQGAAPVASGWVATWMAASQLTEPRNLPPAPGLGGGTLRQVVHLSVGGQQYRLRISNEFGGEALRLGVVRAARSRGRDSIDASSDVAVRFASRDSVRIAAGGSATSDPFELDAGALSDLAVSIHVLEAPAGVTGHPGSRATSFLLRGDHASSPALAGAATTEHWYLLARLDVVSPARAAAVVVLGNSIADGRGSDTDGNTRWPDNLSRRLQADPRTAHVAVLNAGIGGNAVLRGGLGPTALARFERDVLQQPGVRWVIVSEGVNDIGGSAPDSSDVVAGRLIDAYRQLAAQAHARGLLASIATVLPFGGSFYDSPQHEAARQRVNAWIREGRAFDTIVDFDAAMRDPLQPSRLRAEYDGGDHLHPNPAGYRRMAETIDLATFQSGR